MMAQKADEFRDYVFARQDRLLRTAWLLTGNWASAEDLVQTSLVKVWRRWASLGIDDPDAYVNRVMINTYATWWRRKWRGELPSARLPDMPDSSDAEAAVDDRDRLRRLLAGLPRGERIALVLRYYEGLSEADTATVMGCSIGSVKSQASRGAARLRSQQSAREVTEED
jgi:RNA polymerase sigma-70 factor (sigma-E family)